VVVYSWILFSDHSTDTCDQMRVRYACDYIQLCQFLKLLPVSTCQCVVCVSASWLLCAFYYS